jgi:hypothetical protein
MVLPFSTLCELFWEQLCCLLVAAAGTELRKALVVVKNVTCNIGPLNDSRKWVFSGGSRFQRFGVVFSGGSRFQRWESFSVLSAIFSDGSRFQWWESFSTLGIVFSGESRFQCWESISVLSVVFSVLTSFSLAPC